LAVKVEETVPPGWVERPVERRHRRQQITWN
jgi:hypothetical protein